MSMLGYRETIIYFLKDGHRATWQRLNVRSTALQCVRGYVHTFVNIIFT